MRDGVDSLSTAVGARWDACVTIGPGQASHGSGVLSRVRDVRQAAANAWSTGHVHVMAGRSHGASPSILFQDPGPVELSPAGRGAGKGIRGGVSGHVLVWDRFPLLLFLLGQLCIVLLGLLAALSNMGEDGHGCVIEDAPVGREVGRHGARPSKGH